MRRVLVVSPHFPPDSGAASHRMRLLAPRLPEHGWEPTVLTVDPRDLGTRTEPALERYVHGSIRVERVRAPGGSRGRFLGVGDLGLRSLWGIYRRARRLLSAERYELVLITLPPHYTAVLGPLLHRGSGIPYVLDYQDPWVSAWGLTVGGGRNAALDWKSRLSRWLALALEPRALRAAAGLMGVSHGTLQGLLERHPEMRALPRAEVPLGGEPRDFALAKLEQRPNPFFDAGDGRVHLVYVGTLLPLGLEVLRAVLEGAVILRERELTSFARLRFHFLGTSNQREGSHPRRVLAAASELGLGEIVEEHPHRIGYVDALTVQTQAQAILLLGSTERHYTASKIYPALLSGRPLLAVYHEASTVCEVLRQQGPKGATFLCTFTEARGPGSVREAVAAALSALAHEIVPTPPNEQGVDLGRWSASALAGQMAGCLAEAAARTRAGAPSRG